ncbi:MAG: phosphatidylserine decarboxylase proenzyme [Pirellulaceae bacterium]|nr:MAG: phosphatidylserine decarboxylase proenzyme [Pirellulaceae bacterium]
MRLELAWGCLRRFWLRHFRRRYIQRMAGLRRGEAIGCPHEVLDPRDLKYFRNVCDASWAPEDDPFAWRDRLPFARVGLCELLLGTIVFGSATVVFAWLWWPAAVVPAALGAEIWWFFRDPERQIPQGEGLIVAPADGKIVLIEEGEDEFVGGPAVTIGIFLSVFNVHMNRAPADVTVVGQSYHPGKFLNALRPASARENERLETRLWDRQAPERRYRVRQIAGAIARRIVTWTAPGRELARGERFGMIKIGSRTELVLPRQDGLEILVNLGDKVRAGQTILARYLQTERDPGSVTEQ